MKKLLPLFCLLLIFPDISAKILSPRLIEGELIQKISPNGEWIASQIADGSVIITNLETGEYWLSISDGGNKNFYVGLGNSVSDTGTVVGSTTMSNAAYWEKGEWKILDTPDEDYISNATSITPDGNTICGGVGMGAFSENTEITMLYPAVWHRRDDGSFGSPEILPHPDLDLTSRVPQYITAISISKDGKTVGGQVMDYTGGCVEPLVYQCNEKGEWSYTRLGQDLINPTNIEFPEWPGGLDDDILMPTQEWFMTQEQIDEFVEAFNEWDNTSVPPRYEDFMTPEQIKEYQQAMAEYLEIMIPWSEKFEYFMDVYRQYLRSGSSFNFNNGYITPDGKFYICTCNVKYNGISGLHPVIFNLSDYNFQILETKYNVVVSYVADDYSILSYIPGGSDIGTYKAVIFPQMQPGGMLLEDFVKEKNQSLYQWMIDNLTHDVITGAGITTDYITEEMLCTGIPTGTPDLGIIATGNTTYSWYDYFGGEEFVSLILPMDYDSDAGIEVISSDNDKPIVIKANKNELKLNEDLRLLEIYDLRGNKVYSKSDVSGELKPQLSHGIYIIMGVEPNGKTHVLKTQL